MSFRYIYYYKLLLFVQITGTPVLYPYPYCSTRKISAPSVQVATDWHELMIPQRIMRPSIARASSLLATCQKLSSVYRLSEPFCFDTNVTFNEKLSFRYIYYYKLLLFVQITGIPVLYPYPYCSTRIPETLLRVPVPAGTGTGNPRVLSY